jgi:outer membrane receptor protein involved in Fe transport
MKIFLLLIVMFFGNDIYGQFVVSGSITDKTGKPVEFANVSLYRDSVLLKNFVSDSSGHYILSNLPGGSYSLQFSRIGFQRYDTGFLLNESFQNSIILKEDKNQLQLATVTAKKLLIERKADRLIFNIENAVLATGGDALDALKLTPGLAVQNDRITMIGKSGMRVMIDGRILLLGGSDLLSFLRTIRTEDIKSIEVITNPPPKYDAAGNSGLVNIILKSVKKNSWNGSVRSNYTQATYAGGLLGASFGYQKNKFTFFASGGHTRGSTAPIYETVFYYPNRVWADRNTNRDYYYNTGIRTGFDYKPNNGLTFGMQYLGNFNKKNTNELNKSVISNAITYNTDSLVNNFAQDRQKNISHSFNIHADKSIDSLGKKISVDANYFNFSRINARDFATRNYSADESVLFNYFSARNTGDFTIQNYSAKIDIDIPVKWLSLSTGGKVSFTRNSSAIQFFETTTGLPVPVTSLGNVFDYNENIQALYFSGNKKINKQWEVQAGLRMEATQTKGASPTQVETNKKNYTQFFPTAYLVYAPNEAHIFSLNYGRRIERPGFESVNPFRIYNNKYQYQEGNPLLQPYYSHNVEFSYIVKQNWINTLYFSKLSNGFSGVVLIDPATNIQANVILNYFETTSWGISESHTIKIKHWLESMNTANVFYSKSLSGSIFAPPNVNGMNAVIATNNNISINSQRTISLNVNYAYTFKGVANIYRNEAYSQLDIGMRFLFFDKTFQLGIVGNDILKSSIVKQTAFINSLKTTYNNYYDTRYFRISISYKFGNKNLKLAQRVAGNEEERKRAEKK